MIHSHCGIGYQQGYRENGRDILFLNFTELA